jgi:hypothetical protein
LARNRYGWEKRAKEMARKQKNDEKMKRRQGKSATLPPAEAPATVDDFGRNDSELSGLSGRRDV